MLGRKHRELGRSASFLGQTAPEGRREFLQQRIGDGVILRLIHKWLKAGVMEAKSLHYPEHGTPQGGVISPLLANVYLHHVLDQWFEQVVKPPLIGGAGLWMTRCC